MRTGLLECDHVLPELRHHGGDYRDMFPALLPGLGFVHYDVCRGHFPEYADECEAYICTGSRYSVYDREDWIGRLQSFVQELHQRRKKFVGVCFGHQMLGEALGGKVEKNGQGWCVGVHRFSVLQAADWMLPPQENINLLMSCQDQVVRLPPGGEVLATSASCPHAMFRVGSHSLGIQAHPEFPASYARALMEMRVERIGEQTVQRGRESFRLPLHSGVVADWILRFLTEDTSG